MARTFSKAKTVSAVLGAAVLAFQAQAYDLEIHGSNTVGATLAPMLVTGYLEEHGGGQVAARGTGVENEKILRAPVNNRAAEVLVAAHGSSTGFKALAAGEADIWASSRPVNQRKRSNSRPGRISLRPRANT